MTPELILQIIVIIFVGNHLLSEVLSYLNFNSHKPELPELLADHYEEEEYRKSHAYHSSTYSFGRLSSWLSFGVTLAILLLGGFGWLDTQLREVTTHPVGLPLLFIGVLYILSDVLGTPFQWYRTFVIEEKFGFNKTTPRTFVMDKLKGYLLAVIMGGILLGTLIALIQFIGQDFWWWFWIIISIFILGINFVYTSWLVPLFNKLSPLEGGALREQIETYSQKVGFPLTHIMVMDGSKRSTKANAFFSGFGKKKKVVLFDTLVDNYSQDELVAVLAHEVGHYKRKHIIQNFIISILQSGLMLFILSRFVYAENLSIALGAAENGIHLNLLAFGMLYTPISLLLGVGMNVLSRKNEFEADEYAATTFMSKPLQSALKQLHTDTLSNLTPHPLYVFFHYSHPPLLQRLEALKQYE